MTEHSNEYQKAKMQIWYEHKGKAYQLYIPYTVDQIFFEEFCDFQAEERKYIDMTRPPQDAKPGEWQMDTNAVIRQLTSTVSQIVKGSIMSIPFTFADDNLKQMIDGGFVITPEIELSITRLYAHLLSLIRSFKPTQVPTVYRQMRDGRKFELTMEDAETMLTGNALTVGEVVEVLEYQRSFADKVINHPLEIGNLDFTLGLSEFAILVRELGERLPDDRAELDKFIVERRQFWKGLPLTDVLGLRFFLLHTLGGYVQKRATGSSGKGPRKVTPARARKLRRKGRDKLRKSGR